MTVKQLTFLQEISKWGIGGLITTLCSIILYFVVDIHKDFERQKEKIEYLEMRSENHDYRLTNIEASMQK